MIQDNHALTDNDLDIIKAWEKKQNVKCSTLVKKTLTIFSILYRVLNKMPQDSLRKINFDEKFCIEYKLKGCLATCDFNTLTRLVFAAHDQAIRVELCSTRSNAIQIYFHERQHRDIDYDGGIDHPTLEQAVKWWNKKK